MEKEVERIFLSEVDEFGVYELLHAYNKDEDFCK